MGKLRSKIVKHTLQFIVPGTTSRGVLHTKDSWYLIVWKENRPDKPGIGECSIIPGLSIDDRPDFEAKLKEVSENVNSYEYWLEEGLDHFPAIRFGLETAMLDLEATSGRLLFPSLFTEGKKGIPINGLIWMGDKHTMKQQIGLKLDEGFRCIKLKIGAIDFDDELSLLAMIRAEFRPEELELRVDANGAFSPGEALEKLKRLSEFSIHSIEQPIRPNQWDEMARICEKSPVPVALDEELIGVTDLNKIRTMLQTIRPDFVILKPGLLGGFKQSERIINEAVALKTGWWVTSALEGNIGLNAIAQWTYTLGNPLPQGLGTGKLFANNIPSPLAIKNAHLFYQPDINWKLKNIIDD